MRARTWTSGIESVDVRPCPAGGPAPQAEDALGRGHRLFRDTYDRNRNRRRDDDLTHVAIVESVASDGTITLVHKGGEG